CAGGSSAPRRRAGRGARASGRRAPRSRRSPSPPRPRCSAAASGRAAAASSAGEPRPLDHRHLDRRDRRQVRGDLAPALALVGARVDLTRARPEVEAGAVLGVDRHPAPQDTEERALVREAVVEALPAGTAVLRPPDRRVALRHRPAVAGVERDDVEGVAVVRVRGGGEAELGRKALGDLGPAQSCVVAAVHAYLVLLVHARLLDRRDAEAVDAVADLGSLEGPVRAEPLVALRPRLRAVVRLEQAVPLDDRPEVIRIVRTLRGLRDPEVPWRLVRRIVPLVAAGLAVERAQQRERLAAVAALEDAARLGADEQPPVRGAQARDLVQLQLGVVAVAQPLARVLPGLAEVTAAPDGGAVPLASRGGVERPRLLVEDRVVERPALAVRPAQVPVLAVSALEHEEALARGDEHDRLRHFSHVRTYGAYDSGRSDSARGADS